jgi:hypothetical protein
LQALEEWLSPLVADGDETQQMTSQTGAELERSQSVLASDFGGCPFCL